MKRNSIILPVIALMLLSSCVANKKYEEVQAELAKYKVDDTYQGVTLADEKYESSGVMLERGKEILAKDAKIDSLNIVITKLRSRIEECEKGE